MLLLILLAIAIIIYWHYFSPRHYIDCHIVIAITPHYFAIDYFIAITLTHYDIIALPLFIAIIIADYIATLLRHYDIIDYYYIIFHYFIIIIIITILLLLLIYFHTAPLCHYYIVIIASHY
jgi:hypothetical protein